MVSQLTTYVAPDEYLELERKATSKHEYLKGEVFPMTGASLRHNLITVNIATELKQQLKQTDCKVLVSDMRVAASGATLYTYPDVVVVCAEPQLEDKQLDTLLNPCLIIEVLSKSTAAYDREIKFGYYRTIESLTEYLTKGKQIYVEGRLQTRQWDDKDGNKRYTTEIRGDRIVLLGGGGGGRSGGGLSRGGGGSSEETVGGHGGGAPAPDGPEPITDDDIPF